MLKSNPVSPLLSIFGVYHTLSHRCVRFPYDMTIQELDRMAWKGLADTRLVLASY